MEIEIEAKFLDADHDALRAKLKRLGAVRVTPMRLMKRYNFDFPDLRLQREKNGWARVRDEGTRVTVSYKQLNNRTLHGTQEVCLTVDDFDQAKLFLERLGLAPTSYQETKRESWRLGNVEIELDHWPWTRPYVELEGPNEESLKDVVAQLGLDWKNAVHGSVEVVYTAEYDVADEEIDAIPLFKFEEPVPELLAANRRRSA